MIPLSNPAPQLVELVETTVGERGLDSGSLALAGLDQLVSAHQPVELVETTVGERGN